MKIAIPVEEKSLISAVSQSFGRAPYFLIYNIETKESDFLSNSAVCSQGGAGIKAAQTIVDTGVNALLTPRCGENAADVMKASGIKIYKAVKNSAQDNIEAFEEKKLYLLEEIHTSFHHHGGN